MRPGALQGCEVGLEPGALPSWRPRQRQIRPGFAVAAADGVAYHIPSRRSAASIAPPDGATSARLPRLDMFDKPPPTHPAPGRQHLDSAVVSHHRRAKHATTPCIAPALSGELDLAS